MLPIPLSYGKMNIIRLLKLAVSSLRRSSRDTQVELFTVIQRLNSVVLVIYIQNQHYTLLSTMYPP